MIPFKCTILLLTDTHIQTDRYKQTEIYRDRQTGTVTCRLVSRPSHTRFSHALDASCIGMVSNVQTLEVQQVVLLIYLIQLQTHLYLPHRPHN